MIAVSYLSGLSSEERFALELARFLARRGDLVLVVDAAEERHELLREWLPGTRPGLAELLADPELGPLATVPSGIPQLHLLPFGEAAYLPVPGADGLKMAMARMIAEFDRVVIITGAPKRESVAMHLCCGADRVILAGREEDLESTKFQEAVGEANRHRLSVAGLILTRTRPPYQGATR